MGLLIITSGIQISVAQQEPRKLDFIFVLHANQALVPYGDVANDLNYRYVLQVLRSHPSLNITLHVSGTLLSTLQYLDRDTLDMIKAGVDSGQFELLGSTYAQNIPFSQYPVGGGNKTGGDFDNLLGIELHRKMLNEIFGVSPKVFWNPERVWDPDIIPPLLNQSGYQATFVEDHILSAATSSDEHLVRTTGDPNNPLYIFSDDRDLIFNDTANQVGLVDVIQEGPKGEDYNTFMNRTLNNLVSYLRKIYDSDINDEKAVVYAQDMEAWGLWQAETGKNPEEVASRLDALFTRLEQESSWLSVSHPSDVIDQLVSRSYSFEHVNIPFGEAAWMTRIAKNKGFNSWRDWQDTNPSLASYRNDFSKARQDMYAAKKLAGTNSLTFKIYETMKYIYVANQYEFGCITCNFFWWSRTQAVGIGLEGIKWAAAPPSNLRIYSRDLDGDGFLEGIIQSPKSMYVFSASGGRLIAWFNLELQEILLYNIAPSSYMEQPSSNHLQYLGKVSGFWGRSTKIYYLRQATFADFPRYNFTSTYAKDDYSRQVLSDGFVYSITGGDAAIRKEYRVVDDLLQIHYEVENKREGTIMPFTTTLSLNIGGYSEYLFGKTNYVANNSLQGVVISNSRVKVGLLSLNSYDGVYSNPNSFFSTDVQVKLGDVDNSTEYNLILTALQQDQNIVVDREPPTVNILSPLSGESIEGAIRVKINASDNDRISRYVLLVNGEEVYERTTFGELSFYSPDMLTGDYNLTVEVFDVAGNVGSDSVIIHYIGKSVEQSSSATSVTTASYFFWITNFGLSIAVILFRRRP